MATNQKLHCYFTSKELFKPYFLGVFPLDEIKHACDYQQLSKGIKNDGCFFYLQQRIFVQRWRILAVNDENV